MVNDDSLKSKKDKKSQKLFKIFRYLQDKGSFIILVFFTILSTIFALFFYSNLSNLIIIITQPNFNTKAFQFQVLKSFIFLILLAVSNTKNLKAKTNLNSNLTKDIQCSIYSDKSFFNEKSINIDNITTSYLNDSLFLIQNLTFLIYIFTLSSTITFKMTVIITFILIILFSISQIGNEFVNKIEEKSKNQKSEMNSDEEKFLLSVTSFKSLNRDLFECDRYCQFFTLYEKMTNNYPVIREILIECISTLLTAFFIYYSSYLKFIKFEFSYENEDIGNSFVFALSFILNMIVRYFMLFDHFQKFLNSLDEVLNVLEINFGSDDFNKIKQKKDQ